MQYQEGVNKGIKMYEIKDIKKIYVDLTDDYTVFRIGEICKIPNQGNADGQPLNIHIQAANSDDQSENLYHITLSRSQAEALKDTLIKELSNHR